jgi:hypothetical protein
MIPSWPGLARSCVGRSWRDATWLSTRRCDECHNDLVVAASAERFFAEAMAVEYERRNS